MYIVSYKFLFVFQNSKVYLRHFHSFILNINFYHTLKSLFLYILLGICNVGHIITRYLAIQPIYPPNIPMWIFIKCHYNWFLLNRSVRSTRANLSNTTKSNFQINNFLMHLFGSRFCDIYIAFSIRVFDKARSWQLK